MEAKVPRAVLAEETSWVSRVIPARPTSPILHGIRIQTGDGRLELTATDSSASSTTTIDADIITPGTTVVPGKLLAAIASSLPQKPALITVDGSKLQLTCGKSKFSLPTMPLEDYPKPPEQPDQIGILLGSEFSDAVTQIVIAAAKDETLPVLTGVQVKTTETEITLLATDRYRLAVKKLPWKGTVRDPFLIRAKNLSELAKPVSLNPVLLSMDSGSTLFGMTAGVRHSIVPLLDGAFPDVERLIPADGELVVHVDVAELVAAVKRVRLVMDRPNQPLRLTFGNDEIFLDAGTATNSEASEPVEAKIEGERTETAFNPEYLVEALTALAGATARFQLNGPAKPVLLDSPDDPSYRHILMPVKV